MGNAISRAEVTKLANEFGADPDTLSFLEDLPPAELAELRHTLTGALFALQEPRLKRLAGLSKMMPSGITAKIAKATMTPKLIARVAGLLEPKLAAKMATNYKADFLADVAVSIDPTKTAPIIEKLPEKISIETGKVLTQRGETIVLGRLAGCSTDSIIQGVASGYTGDLAHFVWIYTEDRTKLNVMVDSVPDDVLADAMRTSQKHDHLEITADLIGALDDARRERVLQAAAQAGVSLPGYAV